MIATNITEFTTECNEWKVMLRAYQEEIRQMQLMLQNNSRRLLSAEEKTLLERLQNRLYVQLVNVHDLKQAVKNHVQKLFLKISGKAEIPFSDNVSAYHENLGSSYRLLGTIFTELKKDWKSCMNMLV